PELRRSSEPVRQRVPRRHSAPRGSAAWGTPCRTVPGSGPASVRTRLLLFHAEAADRARVVYMPDTTWPVSGHPPGSSRSRRNTPVPMSSQSFGTSATIRSRSPSRSPPDASTDAFSSSLTTTVFSQRSMRRLEASLRRATPKGHETFISRTAPHQGPAPTSSPPRVQDTPRHAQLYLQIAAILRDAIERGDYPPGRPIPSETRLMQEHGGARLNARSADRVLADDGLVEVVTG